jgi:hypothetical protein
LNIFIIVEIIQENYKLVEEKTSDEKNDNLKWIANNDYNVFENESNEKWIEKLNGEPTFEFKPVKLNEKNGILLHDVNRDVYVELNEFDSNYGSSENELRHLYNGRWSDQDYQNRLRKAFNNDDLSSSNLLEENNNSDSLIWVSENGYNLFESSSGDNWTEKLNGVPTFNFQVASFNDYNGVLLYDYDREIYVELNENNSKYGTDEKNLMPLYDGRWLNSDFEKRLKEKFQAFQLLTKRSHSTSRSDFGKHLFYIFHLIILSLNFTQFF